MLVGSTDQPGPARAFDQADDEELAVEMVRVIEGLRPATWATILPVTLPAGMEMRSHPELVEEARREFDNRNDEVRAQAAEVRAEALRRLGRREDGDAAPVVELQPSRERGPGRRQAFRTLRRSKRQDRAGEEPVESDPPVVQAEEPVDEEAQPDVTAFLVAPSDGGEPVSTATIAEEERVAEEEQADAAQVEAAVLPSSESSEVTSEISERIAGYAFPYQRRSGSDRRSGVDRRHGQVEGFDHASDRRRGSERRSGVDRRRIAT